MEDNANYELFLKALSSADLIQARRFAAAKAPEIGLCGISRVSATTGLSRKTIDKCIQVLENENELKKPSGGRKKAENKDPILMRVISKIS